MIADRINVLLCQQQSTAYAVKNYLLDHVLSVSDHVDETCRLKMVDWLYAIVDTCQLRRSAVPIAMTYVDRLLSDTRTHDETSVVRNILEDRNQYQLVVMTCLYIAVKLHEQQIISPELLSKLSLGRYSIQIIEETERSILMNLGWQVSGPTSLDFVEHILALDVFSCADDSARDTIRIISRMQAELSVADQSLLTVPYSTVALASIRNAMDEIGYYTPQQWHQGLQVLSSVVDNIDPFSCQVEEVSAHLKQMALDSANGNLLSRLSSELVCHVATSKGLTKPTLKREISSPTSVSRLSVGDRRM